MKKTKQESDFFAGFGTVEIIEVKTEVWEKYVVKDLTKRYGMSDAK